MTSLQTGSIFEKILSESSSERKKNIFRAPHDKTNPYTLISNRMLRDKNLRHSERGLLCQILSWTDYHFLCINALVKNSREGRDAIRAMIDRLIIAGYIRMFQIKDEQGQFGKVVYQVYEHSTGEVLAELDMAGIQGDESPSESPQLELQINELMEESGMKTESVNQAADGKSVSGKHDTKNNCNERNTNLNSNNGGLAENKSSEAGRIELLKRWHIKIDDPEFQSRLCMAGMQTFIVSQEQLDNFLIDFNQGHYKYGQIRNSQRIKNFVVYLIGLKNTPAQYAKHVARLRALGVYLALPEKRKTAAQPVRQQNCNPFSVVHEAPEQVSADLMKSFEDLGF